MKLKSVTKEGRVYQLCMAVKSRAPTNQTQGGSRFHPVRTPGRVASRCSQNPASVSPPAVDEDGEGPGGGQAAGDSDGGGRSVARGVKVLVGTDIAKALKSTRKGQKHRSK